MKIDYSVVDGTLTGSYFYVPKETLASYMTRIAVGVSEKLFFYDQTIWYIELCQDGYMFGTASTFLLSEDGQEKIELFNNLTGSISPQGKVSMTFESLSPESSNLMIGLGIYSQSCNTFSMQITTPLPTEFGSYTNVTFMHRSYMVPGEPSTRVSTSFEGVHSVESLISKGDYGRS